MLNSTRNPSLRSAKKYRSVIAAAVAPCLCLLTMPSASRAATQVWTSGATGDIGTAADYAAGSTVPSNGDSFTADGAFNITYSPTETFNSLATVDLNVTSGAGTFNQTGGTLSITTLVMGGSGGSRHPVYNLSGTAVLNTSAITFGYGTGTAINVGAGTVVNNTGALTLGTATGATTSINVTGGTFNDSGTSLTLGSSGTGVGTINVSSGVFNANSVASMYLGNSGAAGAAGNLILSGTGTFNLASGVLVLGQFGSTTSATSPTTGTLTMSGTSTLNAAGIDLGGFNGVSYANGVVNLNGGTLSTAYLKEGATNLTPSATQIVLNANGGTIRATAASASFFAGDYVNLASGGLTFNTSGNAVTIANNMTGVGGLTKTGAGTLTLTGTSTYTGATNFNAGTVSLTGSLTGTSAVNVNSGTILTGTGSIGSALNVTGAGTLALTGAGTTSFTANGLTLGDSNAYGTADEAMLRFNASSNAFELINIGTAGNPTGTLTLDPSGAYVSVAGTPTIGTYTLANYGSLTGTGAFSLSPTTPGVETLNVGRQTYSLSANATSLVLTVGGAPIPGVAYFDGAVSNVWNDITTSATLTNFSTDAAGATDAGNVPGATTDVVLDASTKAGMAVTSTLGANTTINSLTINSQAASNTIAADGSTLTINALADNNTASDGSFTGNVAGNGISVLSGSGPVTIMVPIALGGNGSSQTWTNASTSDFNISGGISATGASQILTLSDTSTGNIILSGPLTNGTGKLGINVNSSGSGLVMLTSTSSYTGATTIASGTLQVNPGGLFTAAGTVMVGNTAGAAGTLSLAGGTINQSGNLTIGSAANAVGNLNISSGQYNYTGTASIGIGYGAGGSGNLTMTGGTFNSSSTASIYVDNDGAGVTNGSINLSNSAVLNAPSMVLVLGQYGDTAAAANVSTATLTMSGNAALNVSSITLGCNNNPAYENGIINLNGGTITASSIHRGATYVASSPTSIVLNANGGTVQAIAANTDYFSGIYLNYAAGGLTFNTGSNAVTITNSAVGTGGLTKTGSGTLKLSGSSTYSGGTQVTAGTLMVSNTSALGTGSATLSNGTTLAFPTSPTTFTPYNLQTGFTGFKTNTNAAATFTPVISADGTSVQLTSAVNSEATSVFSSAPVSFNDTGGFSASFTYTHSTTGVAGSAADGVMFVVQNQGSGALGSSGSALGYAGGGTTGAAVTPSLGSVVNLYTDSIGYGEDGGIANTPTSSVPGISSQTSSGVTVVYNAITQTLTETVTNAQGGIYTVLSNIDLASVLGETAGGTATGYIGFTGSTGGSNDNQYISNFAFNASNVGYGALAITNPVIVAPTATATLQLSPTSNYSTGSVGPITVGTGGNLLVSIGSTPATGVVRGVLTTPSVTFSNASSGSLDIRGNALDITGQSAAAVTGLVASAYSTGNWTGPGITSSLAAGDSSHLTAVGVISNTTSTGAQVYGSGTSLGLFEGINPGASDILVKYTYYGDANLDGKVDGSDYTLIDNGYLNGLTGWYNGDFNYDGVVDGSDYTLIDNAFNTQGASFADSIASSTSQIASGSTAAVPEPATLSLLGLASVTMLGRRRSR